MPDRRGVRRGGEKFFELYNVRQVVKPGGGEEFFELYDVRQVIRPGGEEEEFSKPYDIRQVVKPGGGEEFFELYDVRQVIRPGGEEEEFSKPYDIRQVVKPGGGEGFSEPFYCEQHLREYPCLTGGHYLKMSPVCQTEVISDVSGLGPIFRCTKIRPNSIKSPDINERNRSFLPLILLVSRLMLKLRY